MRSVLRALARSCPRCGHRPVFTSWFSMTDRCERCDLVFEREPGYWVGAMTIDTAVTVFLFLLAFALGAILTWPDVPWGWLLGGTITLNLLFPIFFYPYAKTVWLAIDLGFQKLEGSP